MKKLSIYFVRILIFASLGLALYGLWIPRPKEGGDRIYLLDGSRSFLAYRGQALAFIRESALSLSPRDRAGVVVFGKSPSVELALSVPSQLKKLKSLRSLIDPGATNLQRALELALSMTGKNRPFQIILISDGQENRGRAKTLAPLVSSHLRIKTFFPKSQKTIQLISLQAPLQVTQGEMILIRAIFRGQKGQRAEVDLEGRDFRKRENLFFSTEEQEVIFSFSLQKPGFHKFTLRLIETGLSREFALWCEPAKRQILWVSQRPRVFQKEDRAFWKSPDSLGQRAWKWRKYSLVVLEDLPLESLSPETLIALHRFVEELGGNLLVVGGKNSFSLGGYEETLLEVILPVWASPHKKSSPSLSLVLALDISGSMATKEGTQTRWEVALENIFPLRGLRAKDRLGVLCFAHQSKIFSPIQRAGSQKNLPEKLRKIQPGGGTNVFLPIQQAYQLLSKEKTARCHVVVITDGKSQERSKEAFEKLKAWRKKSPKISATFIAVGRDPDTELLQKMASILKARVIPLKNFKKIGKILSQTLRSLRPGQILQRPFHPRGSAKIAFPPFPFQGLVVTSKKKRAQILLWGPEKFPLFATWNYGLGRVGAFTSSLGKPWSPSLEKAQNFSAFLRFLLWNLREKQKKSPFGFSFREKNRTIVVDGYKKKFLNNLSLKLHLGKKIFPLHQTGPGRYQSPPIPLSGLWPCVLEDKKRGILAKTVIGLPPLERESKPNLPLLDLLSGGKFIKNSQVSPLQSKGLLWKDLSPYLILLGIFLFLLEEIFVKWRS